jgi:NitT/TauT family transport system ATP-binding protein
VGEKKKAVLFITHDLDEAIAMSDRVVILSAGPARIRSASSASTSSARATSPRCAPTPRFVELHKAIWDVLREEVLRLPAAALEGGLKAMWRFIKPSRAHAARGSSSCWCSSSCCGTC